MTKAAFFDLVDSLLPDNVTALIQPADLRNIVKTLGEKLYDDDQVAVVRTSQSSVTLGTGSKTFTFVEATAGIGFIVGSRIIVANSATSWLTGAVTAVSQTGVTVLVDNFSGTGTYTAWTIGLAGTAGANGINVDVIRSSVSSNSIGTGTKTWAYSSSANLGWSAGTRLRAYNSAGNLMEGLITSVSTTSVTVDVSLTQGSGTYTSWTLSIAGEKGIDGNVVVVSIPASSSGTALTCAALDNRTSRTVLTGNVTFTSITIPANGQLVLFYQQAATGGPYSITFPGTIIWPYGTAPSMPSAASKYLRVTLTSDGTNIHGNYSSN